MKIKRIEIKKGISDSDMIARLQNFVLSTTNTGMISLELNRVCRKFVKELKEIPLSNEYQNE